MKYLLILIIMICSFGTKAKFRALLVLTPDQSDDLTELIKNPDYKLNHNTLSIRNDVRGKYSFELDESGTGIFLKNDSSHLINLEKSKGSKKITRVTEISGELLRDNSFLGFNLGRHWSRVKKSIFSKKPQNRKYEDSTITLDANGKLNTKTECVSIVTVTGGDYNYNPKCKALSAKMCRKAFKLSGRLHEIFDQAYKCDKLNKEMAVLDLTGDTLDILEKDWKYLEKENQLDEFKTYKKRMLAKSDKNNSFSMFDRYMTIFNTLEFCNDHINLLPRENNNVNISDKTQGSTRNYSVGLN